MNSFTFDGISSATYGFKIREKNIYSGPERNQETVSVPGRDGDLLFDNGSYKNLEMSYSCDFRNVEDNAAAIKSWLCKAGYKILYDTYDPTSYRKASFVGPLNISEIIKNVATADLKFSCKPYKYLYSGETSIELSTDSSASNIDNPTSYSSLPLFEITASGPITLKITTKVGTADAASINRLINFPSTSTKLIVDSELMAVYADDLTLFNNAIDFVNFPIFETGRTAVKFQKGTGATLTSASVKPRWRKL